MSKLEVTIRYANLNRSYDTFGKMENYIKVKINNGLGASTDFKTRIVEGDKDKDIYWNETFSVPLRPNANSIFEFTVLDEDLTSDDVCGKGLFKPDKCGAFFLEGVQNYKIRLVNGANS